MARTLPLSLPHYSSCELHKRAGIRWRCCQIEHAAEIVWPPVCGIIHLLQLDRLRSRFERRFALRCDLAHVLAGDAADLTYARDGHHWRAAEASGFRGPQLGRWVKTQIVRFAPGWPEGRVGDRAETELGV